VKRAIRVVALGLAVAGLFMARDGAGQKKKPKRNDLAVIVHPNNPVGDIALSDLAAIFRKDRKTWPSGERVMPLNWNPRTPPRVTFDAAVLKMTPDEAAAYWIDQRIRGKGDPPRTLGSAGTIQAIVARQEEAVAYLPLDQVGSGVKILQVGGAVPGQAGYPIPPAEGKAE
jgi:hypothetical protein